MAAPMEEEEPPCGRCGAAAAPYTCPRCNQRLCSLGCYRAHGACAEAFYREQVLQALAAERGEAPPGRGRVQAALGRLRELREAGDPQAPLGRGLWERLSPAQKAEFLRMVRSGEALRLLPPWRPWWWRRGPAERLVEELGPGEEETGGEMEGGDEKKGKMGKRVGKVDKKEGEMGEKVERLKENECKMGKKVKKVDGKDKRDLGDEEKEDKVAKKLDREDKNAKKEDRKANGGHEEDKRDLEDSKEDVEERKEAKKGEKMDRKRNKMGKKRDKVTEKEAKMANGGQKDDEEDVEDEDNGDEEEEEEEDTEDDDEGPAAPLAVPPLRSLRAAPASPLLRFQLPNVLYGYAFALCLHRGDRALLPEMASAALASAAALRARRPFASTAEALHDARREAEAAGYPPCPLGSAGTVLAVAQLLRGRRRRRPGEDAEAALQHLGRLLGAARRRLRGEEEERGRLGRARKKCLYLLAWSREHGAELAALAEEAAQLHAEMAAAEAEAEALRGRLEAAWGGPRPPARGGWVEEVG
eukprot:XP_027304433.1 zinc finger HIT domain-containing protein 2 [Anas platyrhynchos]